MPLYTITVTTQVIVLMFRRIVDVALAKIDFQLFSILSHSISYVNNSLTINCNKPNVNIMMKCTDWYLDKKLKGFKYLTVLC